MITRLTMRHAKSVGEQAAAWMQAMKGDAPQGARK